MAGSHRSNDPQDGLDPHPHFNWSREPGARFTFQWNEEARGARRDYIVPELITYLTHSINSWPDDKLWSQQRAVVRLRGKV